jgi:Na+-transporting NADH:ubiquinone oxidoreductase subunit C
MAQSEKKKINVNSNAYTVIYSVVMVVVVAVLLTIAATALKPAQQKNKEIEKKQFILKTVGKTEGVETATNKAQFIDEQYSKYIVESYVVDESGNKKDGDAFATELKVQLRVDKDKRVLPVFVCKDGDKTLYVFQLYGRGLWGPIWGYVALESDFNTIAGVVFDHEGETPGLGAEITTEKFQAEFINKQILENGTLPEIPITVQKPGPELNNHTVDGISGGTITSRGVQAMFADNLKDYLGFINKMRAENANKSNVEQEKNISNE